ncbi:protein DPCD-like [Styela clava]|uniref:protein DPCD-like n=1 Tax=Styela clava TaxID=7725 RepID=UPI0019394E74|nr:protein DPCD-like [Styela clava]
MSFWVDTLRSARKTALLQDGRRKVHYTFPDGNELAEEYDVKTNDLIVRKWRKKTTLGGPTKWDMEIGEDQNYASNLVMGAEHMVESMSNPVLCRRDTKKAFQWRIRNLPYSLETFSVKVEDKDTIVVRTSNKKYFKKIDVPDMQRAKIPLNQSDLTFAHANNTLIIQYKKPKQILDDHETIVREIEQLKVSKDGDVDCKQS